MNKICPKCNQEYPATKEYFYSNSSKKDGLGWACKKCSNGYVDRWANKNTEESFDIKRKYRLKKLGFTPEIFNEMLQAQKNCCALCETNIPGGPRGVWAADHDHNTGKPRGLLCMSCNTTLGHIETKPSDWTDKAKAYLEQGGFH